MPVQPEEGQPELFDFTDQTRPRPRVVGWRVAIIHVRYDHLMLLGVVGLIGLTVIFALGVERGKGLARAERAILVVAPDTQQRDRVDLRSSERVSPAVRPATATRAASGIAETPKASTSRSTLSGDSGTSRYAIQLVTYSQPKLARRELSRLHEQGERAFLVRKSGRVVLYVGPFPSKERARENLSKFRQQYQDCFIRTL